MGIIQTFVGSILFFVLFFGISFILNMLLRKTWVMSFVYPLIVFIYADDISTGKYFTDFGYAIESLGNGLLNLVVLDIIYLTVGFLGTIVAGIVIKTLRSKGYQMF